MTRHDTVPHPPWSRSRVSTIAARLRASGPPRGLAVIGVDGRSGSGKSTIATALAAVYGDATVVHTDDIAWHHSFFDWDQLLVDHVLEPLRHRGPPVTFRPRPWTDHGRHGALTVPDRTGMIVVEGVGSCRASLRCWYDATVWVDAPEHAARQRVLARGTDSQQFIDDWNAQENAVMEHERPWAHADVVVAGTGGRPGSSGTLVTVLVAPGPHTARRSRPTDSWPADEAAPGAQDPPPGWPRRADPTEETGT